MDLCLLPKDTILQICKFLTKTDLFILRICSKKLAQSIPIQSFYLQELLRSDWVFGDNYRIFYLTMEIINNKNFQIFKLSGEYVYQYDHWDLDAYLDNQSGYTNSSIDLELTITYSMSLVDTLALINKEVKELEQKKTGISIRLFDMQYLLKLLN
jgi:hypothetical protein